MRGWLRWLLVITVLSSFAALLWPDGVTQAISRTEASMASAAVVVPDAAQDPTASDLRRTLPERLATVSLDKASFDPFVGKQAPPPPPPPPIPAPVVQVAAPPPPSAPPFDYRYLGRMVDPAGKQYVYLGKSGSDTTGAAVVVSIGTQLDEGYMVEAIEPTSIRLTYPPLDTHVAIDIPPAQETSAR